MTIQPMLFVTTRKTSLNINSPETTHKADRPELAGRQGYILQFSECGPETRFARVQENIQACPTKQNSSNPATLGKEIKQVQYRTSHQGRLLYFFGPPQPGTCSCGTIKLSEVLMSRSSSRSSIPDPPPQGFDGLKRFLSITT